MGNFSRDTFDPTKNYLGVRLQQGVPLVDADWNELNDVIRHEAYQGFEAMANRYSSQLRVFMNSSAFQVRGTGSNNLYMIPGTGFGEGRPLVSNGYIFYESQPLRDPAQAAAWGVDPVPALTTPSADRTDTVYLDVWDREIDSDEDPDLINPVIGVETAVRLRRELALRVNEGTTAIPSPAPGHRHYLLARLSRQGGNADIENEMISDERGVCASHLPGYHYLTVPTFFNNYFVYDLWRSYINYAFKPAGDTVAGVIPVHLPNGCRLRRLHFTGTMSGISSGSTRLFVRIYRSTATSTSASDSAQLVGDERTNDASFSRYLYVPSEDQRVDATTSKYFIYTYSIGPGSVRLRDMQINYEV